MSRDWTENYDALLVGSEQYRRFERLLVEQVRDDHRRDQIRARIVYLRLPWWRRALTRKPRLV